MWRNPRGMNYFARHCSKVLQLESMRTCRTKYTDTKPLYMKWSGNCGNDFLLQPIIWAIPSSGDTQAHLCLCTLHDSVFSISHSYTIWPAPAEDRPTTPWQTTDCCRKLRSLRKMKSNWGNYCHYQIQAFTCYTEPIQTFYPQPGLHPIQEQQRLQQNIQSLVQRWQPSLPTPSGCCSEMMIGCGGWARSAIWT